MSCVANLKSFYIIPFGKAKNVHITNICVLTYIDKCGYFNFFCFLVKDFAKIPMRHIAP